jgi:hypothetical protein
MSHSVKLSVNCWTGVTMGLARIHWVNWVKKSDKMAFLGTNPTPSAISYL